MARENEFLESYKNLCENKNRLAEKEAAKYTETQNKKDQFMKDYYSIKESREQMIRRHGNLMEMCRDNALGTAIKAIYISALEAGTLTDQGIILAENMVDAWIKENGGASKILSGCKNKTYLLHRISEIVEEAAVIEAEEIENIQDDKLEIEEEPVEEPKEDANETGNNEIDLALKVVSDKLDTEDPEVKNALDIIQKKAAETVPASEEPAEEESEEEKPAEEEESKEDSEEKSEEEESKEDSEDEESDDEEEPVEDDDDSDDDILDDASGNSKEEPVEDTESDKEVEDDISADSAEDVEEKPVENEEVEDAENEEIDLDEPIEDEDEEDDESHGKVFDELEKEDDVKKAVELIKQRVADAEETFIKRNAEDKKEVEKLIGKISDNVKAVENMDDKDSDKAEVAKEHVRLAKQKIGELTEHKQLTVLEKMTRNLNENILKNTVVKEQYMTEEGTIDTDLIVEAGKVMYGFLETLNTLQLEKVDANYIANILNNMN